MLADVERLHYLKTRVQGEAEERIKNLPTTSDNFKRVWAILEERYENKRVLVRSCLSTFSMMSRMKTESVTDLKKLVNSMLQTASTLESIGQKSAYDNDFFMPSVIELMNSRSRREWEEATGDLRDPPSFDSRSFWSVDCSHWKLFNRLRGMRAQRLPSTSLFSQSARANLAQKTKQSQCTLCQKEHYILHCNDFQKKQPAQKKEFAESKLCFNCFGNHALTECPSRKSCAVCNARHHSSIHDVCISKVSSKLTASSSASPTSLHVHQFEEKKAAVLLATAQVGITDKYGARHTVRALIDPGSEISIASEALNVFAFRAYPPQCQSSALAGNRPR
ncbi:uncharacterized protein LOC113004793 [Solenopsis invicta]|uniref:uncharacterized protein LOC113004793 n=1 Tax=Solenopsis invicta TaxID=13686 RepID=UPI00193CDCFE|nr:uncharacterized protein LOC113004793 [Solenopsis invicta]XP_039314907.1 uncharacterized protein LOC113004793 [Solenopsis invicta]